MAFQLKQLTVPCLLSILLLLSSISSFAKTEPCTCSDSEQDPRSNHTVTTDGAGLKIHLINRDSGVLHTGIHSLSNAVANSTGVLSTFDRWIQLWQRRPDGRRGVDEASFSFNIVYNPLRTTPTASYSGLAFLILPRDALGLPGEVLGYLEAENGSLARQLVSGDVGTVDLLDATSRNASLSGASVSVKIGTVQAANLPNGSRIMGVDVTVNLVAADDSNRYGVWSVWIDYDRVGRSLSVYADVAGNPKPDNAIAEVAHLSMSSVVTSPHIYFGVLSTVDQVLRSAVRWNATIEDLPRYDVDNGGGFLSRKVTILSLVLGSVATTAMVAAGVAFYFNSKYRRWHKDLDELARSMERLPGVPTKVEFSEIKKATGNFHETMKLGGGGFGTVYRCTLPAAASKTEQPMDIAVKRFIRDVRNRRYDDFLAEVSIINRLRHKNIVPLIGSSYNKGEPLLLFEFMTNGSLDNHLFPKYGNGSSSIGQRHTGFALRRWATRYEIVRDIATGLHYVHHEYEPMVLHRDIKASNVMLDSSFCARLGDFGLSCTIAIDRNSATVSSSSSHCRDWTKMPTIKIKVDLDCSRCHRKIEKVLDRIREKGEFVIDDIEYDEKNNKVIVKGPFDADRLADKLCCKACKIIKEIEIVEPPPPPPPPEPEPPKKEEPAPPAPEPVVEEPPPPPVVVVPEPACEPEPEPPKKEEPVPEVKPPPPAPTKVVEVLYPWPFPYPYPAWPSDCCCHHGHGGCHCCSCKDPPAPAPAPPPPQYNIYPQYPQYPPCGGYKIVCEEDPNYACAIM